MSDRLNSYLPQRRGALWVHGLFQLYLVANIQPIVVLLVKKVYNGTGNDIAKVHQLSWKSQLGISLCMQRYLTRALTRTKGWTG